MPALSSMVDVGSISPVVMSLKTISRCCSGLNDR
jgi:hypothetical protein